MKTVKTSLPPQQPTDFSPGVGSIPCRFFQIGQCAKGTKCPFMHKKTAPHFTPQSCKFFQTGACKYGDRCPFLHETTKSGVESKVEGDTHSSIKSRNSSTSTNTSSSTWSAPVPRKKLEEASTAKPGTMWAAVAAAKPITSSSTPSSSENLSTNAESTQIKANMPRRPVGTVDLHQEFGLNRNSPPRFTAGPAASEPPADICPPSERTDTKHRVTDLKPPTDASPRPSFFDSIRNKHLTDEDDDDAGVSVAGPSKSHMTSPLLMGQPSTEQLLPTALLAHVNEADLQLDETDVVESLFGRDTLDDPKSHLEKLQQHFIDGLLDEAEQPTTSKRAPQSSTFVPSATAPILAPRSGTGPLVYRSTSSLFASSRGQQALGSQTTLPFGSITSPSVVPQNYMLLSQDSKADSSEPLFGAPGWEAEEDARQKQHPAGVPSLICELCNLPVFETGRKFGLLSDCSNVFCLMCIKEYRISSGSDECPICGTVSHTIIPSTFFTAEKSKKEDLLNLHKEKLRKIPCKHFNFGRGSCKYGSSCYYAHTDINGNSIVSSSNSHRTIIDSDGGIRQYSDLTLGSFIEVAERIKR